VHSLAIHVESPIATSDTAEGHAAGCNPAGCEIVAQADEHVSAFHQALLIAVFPPARLVDQVALPSNSADREDCRVTADAGQPAALVAGETDNVADVAAAVADAASAAVAAAGRTAIVAPVVAELAVSASVGNFGASATAIASRLAASVHKGVAQHAAAALDAESGLEPAAVDESQVPPDNCAAARTPALAAVAGQDFSSGAAGSILASAVAQTDFPACEAAGLLARSLVCPRQSSRKQGFPGQRCTPNVFHWRLPGQPADFQNGWHGLACPLPNPDLLSQA